MKLIALLSICEKLLRMLDKYEVNIIDYRYIQMYYDFEEMRKTEKYEYVIDTLASKYNTSISTVKRMLKKFNKDIVNV